MIPPLKTTADICRDLPPVPGVQELPAPAYAPTSTSKAIRRVMLAVEEMRRHTTDEGWQLAAGLDAGGYVLIGRHLPPFDDTHVPTILEYARPEIVVLQDKREWDIGYRSWGDVTAEFRDVDALRDRHDIFKLTVLKDSHSRPDYHRQSADEIGCHAWITYYHPDIVKHTAPFVRREHLVRTYHSIDRDAVPVYSSKGRAGCLLSGAVSGAYPLRQRLFARAHLLPETTVKQHPGYNCRGTHTPEFLKTLARHKIAICTASRYGFALRKIIEATACGCRVLTDLPCDDILPGIDGNLTRIHPDMHVSIIADVLRQMLADYDPALQVQYAEVAKQMYDYRITGRKLAAEIEELRCAYSS